MKQEIGKGAAAFITIILLFIAPVVIMDTAYAADTINTKTSSDEVKQSKNIQNKTDINIKRQTVLSRLLSVGSEYTLKTNLEDSFIMRSSKKTFDVWARKGGVKMPACATLFRLNSAEEEKYVGEINVAWDDGNKSSFTLDMSSQARGDFLIKVWTGGDSIENASVIKIYHFTYEKTPKGGYIGDIVIDIEAFTISLGYLEEPERLPIYEGDNSATVIDRYLKSKGYTYESTGSVESGFYLGRIRGLKSIDLSSAKLESTVATVVDNDEWNQNDYEEGSLGEKDFTAYSGWMYSVNNVFPNVGFSEFYFQPDDVVRIQFTVATGREIGGSGGSGGTGSDYYSVADKDELTALLANINSSINSTQIKDDQEAARLIAQAIEKCQKIAVDQDDIDVITDEIRDYLGKNSESPTIELNTAGITLKKGNTQKVEATVGDITTLSPLFLRWDSEEPEIATVDSVGNITAQSSGATVITVSIGGSSASCNVTVEEIPLEGIKLVPVTLWSGGTDPYLEYKTESGYRFPTDTYPEFMVEPIPSDTTDDLTPQYSINTKKYMDLTVSQDYTNRCCLIGKHEGTSVLTAMVGEYSDQLEIEYYENKVTSFTCDDPEPVLSINGYEAVRRKVLTFTTYPNKAQDKTSVYFASSDSNVFAVSEPLENEGSGSVIKKTIYARGEGVADLYVTIGNITKTYPVAVYDLKESDEIVPNGYDKFSQVYLSSDTNKAIDWIGGYRYRAGAKYNGTNDATQFNISLYDPSGILSFNGVSYTYRDFVCSGYYQDIYAITYIWPLPTFTGATGTAIFTNNMFGKECMLTKITVADDVVPVESVKISNGEDTNNEGIYSINDKIDLQTDLPNLIPLSNRT